MNIDIKDRVSLNDNNTYVVVGKTNYEGKTYFQFVDINNPRNIKFCYENINNHSVIEITDQETIRILLPLFIQNIPEDIKNIILNSASE